MVKKTLGYVELEWRCPRCGSRNPGPEKTCNGCGAPQPEDVEFEQPAEEELVTEESEIERAKAGPDVHCAYCGARNPADAEICTQCGADLTEASARVSGRVVGAHRDKPAADVAKEVDPVDVVHGVEVPALVDLQVVNRDDVGVLEPGGALRLAEEALDLLLRRVFGREQDLEGHGAAEASLLCEIHDSHTASSELPQNLRIPEERSGRLRFLLSDLSSRLCVGLRVRCQRLPIASVHLP